MRYASTSHGWVLGGVFALALVGASCGDDVARGDAGPDCEKASSEEKNCMFCSSKPGCGWCTDPASGEGSCQPGTSDDDEPSTCEVPLLISPEDCEAPPPPAEGDGG